MKFQPRPLKFKTVLLSDVRLLVDKDKPIAFDVETDKLYGRICLAQFYQQGWEEVLLVEKPDIFELSATVKGWHLVAHNISYEVSTIQTQLGTQLGVPLAPWQPKEWDDTLLLAKLQYYDSEKFSLDQCYIKAFGYDPYAAHDLDKKEFQKADWRYLNTSKRMYASLDVFYLLDLYEACIEQKDTDSYRLDVSATTNAFEFQRSGIPINPVRVRQQMAQNNARVVELDLPINVNSYQQVRPYIDEDESDGLALATFALQGNTKARDVQEARKLIKQNSFLQKYLDTQHENRIYGKFTFTTKSGRGNCKDQNLQQLPRLTKSVFEAPEGRVLTLSDYSQLELRYACAVTNEQRMAELFRSGEDMHAFTAEILGVTRQVAKTCNFNLIYGGSAKMLRSILISDAGLLLPIQEVSDIKRKWHSLWPSLTEWQEKTTTAWRNGKGQQTILGRKFKSKLYTDAMNLPIQGGSTGDISKLAMHRMFKARAESPNLQDDSKFVNFVHDSFIWETDQDPLIYEPLAKITAEAMKSAWTDLVKFTAIPDLPMPVTVKTGKNWGLLDYEKETPIYQITI